MLSRTRAASRASSLYGVYGESTTRVYGVYGESGEARARASLRRGERGESVYGEARGARLPSFAVQRGLSVGSALQVAGVDAGESLAS